MNNFKRILCIALAVVLIIGVFSFTSADETEKYTIEMIKIYNSAGVQLSEIEIGTLSLKAYIRNNNIGSQPMIVVALCEGNEEDGYLIRSIDYKDDISFEDGEKKEITFGLNCRKKEDSFVKIFIYENSFFRTALASEEKFPNGTEGLLEDLKIDDISVEGFDKSVFEYQQNNLTAIPEITPVPIVDTAVIEKTLPEKLPGIASVKVILNGETTEYKIKLYPYMDGSEEYPYLISTLEDFEKIGTGEYGMDKCYRIIADIGTAENPVTKTIGSFEEWFTDPSDMTKRPIPFTGKIIGDVDGEKPVIYVNIDSTYNYKGLIALLSGTVENLVIEGSVKARGYVGSVAGRIDGATIKNVTNKASVTSVGKHSNAKNQANSIGGIAGGSAEVAANGNHSGTPAAGSLIENCINEGNIATAYHVGYTGGIVGSMFHKDDTLINCRNDGSVIKSNASTYVGYVAGIAGYLNRGKVVACVNNGEVSLSNASGETKDGTAAGIAGFISGANNQISSISQCYNTGKVSAHSYAGGILGLVNKNCAAYYNVSDCYNTGEINSSIGYAGGIVADIPNVNIKVTNTYNIGVVKIGIDPGYMLSANTVAATTKPTTNFYLSTLDALTPVCGEIAKTEDELKALELGENWIIDGIDYPRLKVFE